MKPWCGALVHAKISKSHRQPIDESKRASAILWRGARPPRLCRLSMVVAMPPPSRHLHKHLWQPHVPPNQRQARLVMNLSSPHSFSAANLKEIGILFPKVKEWGKWADCFGSYGDCSKLISQILSNCSDMYRFQPTKTFIVPGGGMLAPTMTWHWSQRCVNLACATLPSPRHFPQGW